MSPFNLLGPAFLFAALFALPCRAEEPPSEDQRLAAILKRAENDDPAVREGASADLKLWCEDHRENAEEILGKAAEKLAPEARARVNEVLSRYSGLRAELKLVGMLDALELPPVKALKFVEFNTGMMELTTSNKEFSFVMERGWLVEVSEENITISTADLLLKTRPRKRGFPSHWDEIKSDCRNPEPAPGEFREVDFEQQVIAELKDPPTSEEEGTPLRTATRAWWSFQRGLQNAGHEQLGLALSRLPAEGDGEFTDEYRLASALTDMLTKRLYKSALAGTARSSLLRSWKQLSSFPANRNSTLVTKMVTAYEAQLADEAASPDLTVEELLMRPVAERAEYWIHRLRDVDAELATYAGKISLLDSGYGERQHPGGPPWPPAELIALGFDIVPVLVAHFEDEGPTREPVYPTLSWSGHSEKALITVGDVCEMIFAGISGMYFYKAGADSVSMTRDGKAASVRVAAQAWFQSERGRSSEERMLDLLATNPVRATVLLIKSSGTRHLSEIVQAIRTRPDGTDFILPCLGKRLGSEHADLLRAMLGASDGPTVQAAAESLFRLAHDDAGVKEIVSRLKSAASIDHLHGFELEIVLPLIAKCLPDEGSGILADLLGRDLRQIDRYALELSPLFADPRVLDALLSVLDRRANIVLPCSGKFAQRHCDLAAQAIAKMAGWTEEWPESDDTELLDGKINELKAWVAAHRKGFDWAKLKVRALQAGRER